MRPAHGYALALFLGIPLGLGLLVPPGLSGRVTDGRAAVTGARVRYQGGCTAALTDRHGVFHLPAPPGRARRGTAWKEGYSIAATPADGHDLVLALPPLPVLDDDSYAWVDPTPAPARPNNCGNCHADIHREWAAGAHAGAAT